MTHPVIVTTGAYYGEGGGFVFHYHHVLGPPITSSRPRKVDKKYERN